jgi:hypothetical protein
MKKYLRSSIPNSEPSIHGKAKNPVHLPVFSDTWRVCEFVDPSLLPVVAEDLRRIDAIENFFVIREPSADNNFGFGPLYTKQYFRDRIPSANLNIPLNRLRDILHFQTPEALILDYELAVTDGFYFSTNVTSYYGIIKHDVVQELYVCKYDGNSDEELHAVARAFNLAFVDWYDRLILPCFVSERKMNWIINNLDFYTQNGDWYYLPFLVNDLKLTGVRMSGTELRKAVELNAEKYIVDKNENSLRINAEISISFLIKTPPQALYFTAKKNNVGTLLQNGVSDFEMELGEMDQIKRFISEQSISVFEVNSAEMCYDGFDFFYSPILGWHIPVIPAAYLKVLA